MANGVTLGTADITASWKGITSPVAVLTVAQGQSPQVITFTPPTTAAVGSPVVFNATASSGLTVNLSSITPSTCTLSRMTAPAAANFLSVGTCLIVASQPGDGTTYAAAQSMTATITVGVGGQAIVFPPITGFQSVGGSVGFSASASSGLPVTFSTTSAGVCTVNGNTATFSGAGTCTITASVGGSSNYLPATVAQSLMVSPKGLSFYDITTFAGNGTLGYSGDGGLATNAQLNLSYGVAVDGSGSVYIADLENNRIRRVTPDGTISTIAGNGTEGFSGDGGPALNAQLNLPAGVAIDSSGNIYISDYFNNRIRLVNKATGYIDTIAGNGTEGYSGDGGPATNAELNGPGSLALDRSGNLYIVDQANNRIRMVSAVTGNISTIAGTGVYGYSGDGGAATNAQLGSPAGVAVDSSGNVYIADSGNARIRMISAATGYITTIAGTGIYGFTGDGGPATSARFYGPYSLAVDSNGNLYIYIADSGNNRIRMISAASGYISTIAGGSSSLGDGGPANNAQLNYPTYVALDGSGNVYIADQHHDRIRELTPVVLQSIAVTPATVTIAPGSTQQFTATAIYSDGTTQTVTSTAAWNSTNTSTAAINAAGLAAGITSGQTNITASLNGLTSAASLVAVTTSTATTSSATYVSTDKNTQGTWTNVYGTDGNLIANNSTAPPSYATVSLTGDATWT